MEDPVPTVRGTAMSPEPREPPRHIPRPATPPAPQGAAARSEAASGPSVGQEEAGPAQDDLDPQLRWHQLRERLEGNRREFRQLRTRINAAFEELRVFVADHGSTEGTRAWEKQSEDIPKGFRAFADAIAESRAARAEEARRAAKVARRRDKAWERACLCQEEVARLQREMREHLREAGIPPNRGGRRTTRNCYICGHPGVRNSHTCPNHANHRRVRGQARAEEQ